MKLITRDTDYAVRALCFMSEWPEKIISVSELVKHLAIPRPFLRKICQTLNKRGLLRSYKGIGGGFSLASPPDKIYLVKLIEIFQGPFKLNECLFKKSICPDRGSCVLRRKIGFVEEKVVNELKAITIKSLTRAPVHAPLACPAPNAAGALLGCGTVRGSAPRNPEIEGAAGINPRGSTISGMRRTRVWQRGR